MGIDGFDVGSCACVMVVTEMITVIYAVFWRNYTDVGVLISVILDVILQTVELVIILDLLAR